MRHGRIVATSEADSVLQNSFVIVRLADLSQWYIGVR